MRVGIFFEVVGPIVIINFNWVSCPPVFNVVVLAKCYDEHVQEVVGIFTYVIATHPHVEQSYLPLTETPNVCNVFKVVGTTT